MTIMEMSDIDKEEAIVNFRYSLAIMLQNGDNEGLAKAKKNHPDLYTDWEKRYKELSKKRVSEQG